uniref:Uncharacterized protein n=1 Tax=Sus scrofa TaxID=9823 RepID=A0A8D0RUB4_PIG
MLLGGWLAVCICVWWGDDFDSLWLSCLPALTEGYVGSLHDNRQGSSAQVRRRKASGDPYWAYSGNVKFIGLIFNYTLSIGFCILLSIDKSPAPTGRIAYLFCIAGDR